jgi:hypothetical protein
MGTSRSGYCSALYPGSLVGSGLSFPKTKGVRRLDFTQHPIEWVPLDRVVVQGYIVLSQVISWLKVRSEPPEVLATAFSTHSFLSRDGHGVDGI